MLPPFTACSLILCPCFQRAPSSPPTHSPSHMLLPPLQPPLLFSRTYQPHTYQPAHNIPNRKREHTTSRTPHPTTAPCRTCGWCSWGLRVWSWCALTSCPSCPSPSLRVRWRWWLRTHSRWVPGTACWTLVVSGVWMLHVCHGVPPPCLSTPTLTLPTPTQDVILNASLTAITMLWSVTDTLARAKPSAQEGGGCGSGLWASGKDVAKDVRPGGLEW